jgi:Tfp pilus assembly protein PilO
MSTASMPLDLRTLARPKVIVPVVGVLVLVLAWWFAWMSPEGAKLASVRRQQQEQQVQAASLAAQLARLRADAKQVRAASPFLKRFASAIPSVPDSPGIVEQIYRLSVSDGVSLESITDNTLDPTSQGYSTIPVTLSVSGPHDSVLAFLSGLYKLPRLLTLQTVNLSGTGDVLASGLESYDATVDATAYTTYVVSSPSTAVVSTTTTTPPTTG